MKKLYVLLMVITITVFSEGISFNASSMEIILNTEISPPYQIMQGGKLSGLSVRTLECIFKKMSQSYKIKIVPWLRAQNNVENNTVQGFFTSMSFAKADRYATLSSPIALEKWYFYFKDKTLAKKKDFSRSISIAAIRGSNQANWLKSNGYSKVGVVGKNDQLLQVLDMGRFQAILTDQKTFKETASKAGVNTNKFTSKFVKFTPLGIYFSKSFLKSRPSFIEEFNKNVFICAPETIKLNSQEKRKLQKHAVYRIKKWMNNSLVIKMVKKQNTKNKTLTQTQITSLDKQWRNEVKSSKKPLINKILANSLSKYLQKIKSNSNGLYSEIFVMDNKGLNVGQSDITSDYWQGDEAKFKKTFGTGRSTMFIDEIEYDESTREFQVQINMTVNDPSTKLPVGAITVGVDLEKALSSEN